MTRVCFKVKLGDGMTLNLRQCHCWSQPRSPDSTARVLQIRKLTVLIKKGERDASYLHTQTLLTFQFISFHHFFVFVYTHTLHMWNSIYATYLYCVCNIYMSIYIKTKRKMNSCCTYCLVNCFSHKNHKIIFYIIKYYFALFCMAIPSFV